MEDIKCIVCESSQKHKKFTKAAKDGELFQLVACKSCGLQYVSPRPTIAEIAKYYSAEYFMQRTERGYDNYFSEKVKDEIERVIKLNITDLGFFEFSKQLQPQKQALDIGCAAGYFVNYLQQQGWDSQGIDVSTECVDFAREHGLAVVAGDYLQHDYKQRFDLITMWASIEHLHTPELFLKKIYMELADHGRLYISTCRVGVSFSKLYGSNWRFYNFPEHLFFFSLKTLKRLLQNAGFEIETSITYGSGIGKGGTLLRKAADFLAKHARLGDMMLISAKKKL